LHLLGLHALGAPKALYTTDVNWCESGFGQRPETCHHAVAGLASDRWFELTGRRAGEPGGGGKNVENPVTTQVQRVPVQAGESEATAGEPEATVPPTGHRAADRRWEGWIARSPGLVAVVVWLVALPVGFAVVKVQDPNPLTVGGVTTPIVAGFLLGLVALGIALRYRATVVAGAIAGLYAAWCGTVIATALNGTPYGYGSQLGDAGRMSAMVMHFSESWAVQSVGDPSAPSEYPPLYPMLVGFVGRLFDVPAWTLLGWSQAILVSAAVLVSFLMWKRIVPVAPAFVLAAVLTLAFAEPSKANELLVLGMLIPTILATFAPLPADVKRLNPIVAGVLFGLIVPWHPSHMVLSLAGIAALMLLGWRAAEDRRAYVWRAVIVVAIAAVVSSWFTVPLAAAYLTRSSQVVADQYVSAGYPIDPLPIFFGGVPENILIVVGLVGLAALWRLAWWARPMAVYLIALLAVEGLMFARLILEFHTFMLPYVKSLVHYTLLVNGVLVLWYVWSEVVSPRIDTVRVPRHAVGVILVAGVLASTGADAWATWMPSPRGDANASSPVPGDPNNASLAHQEWLPDGSRPRWAMPPGKVTKFPSDAVAATIRAQVGPGVEPTTLSYDQRLFSFYPWPNWLPPSRTSASSLLRWDDRWNELRRLARIQDPAAFASATAATEFGSIDVFVLKRQKDGNLRWTSAYHDVDFTEAQFATAFTVTPGLPGDTVVAVRR
jgi:hypothetical protein